MNRASVLIIVILIGIIGVLAWRLFARPQTEANQTETTTEESSQNLPATTTEPNLPFSASVTITSPKPSEKVSKTFIVAGEAPGPWYFEASFPIQVRDPNGKILGTVSAGAESDWMTTELVPFKATMTTSGYSGPATLILLKNNPSGLPENEDAVEIPIVIQ